jgi:hypothetical protein
MRETRATTSELGGFLKLCSKGGWAGKGRKPHRSRDQGRDSLERKQD